MHMRIFFNAEIKQHLILIRSTHSSSTTMSSSNVQKFYKDQTVLVTGGTGFIGKLLIWKLLATCYDVKQIYLLLREKKNKSPEERLDKLLESYIFQLLKIDKEELKKKCKVINGDCVLPNLGISQEDQKLLINEVSCIVHVSATVKFDEHIRIASYTNVRSVLDLLELAKEMKNLKAMVYVSTAYSNCTQKDEIKEMFYDPPMTPAALMKLLETVDNDDYLSDITPRIIGNWPNTYTFTKAVAENLIKERGQHLPIAIVRPAIVLAPMQEPEPGYTDTLQGLGAASMGIYLGILRCMLVRSENIINIVPADYVVNNILSAAAHIPKISTNIPIYNLTGSPQNAITWGSSIEYGSSIGKSMPSMRCIWWMVFITTTNVHAFNFYAFMLHTVPAHLADWVLICLRKKPLLVKLYKKVDTGTRIFRFFSLNSWNFNNTNIDNLWEVMNEEDKELFPFNMDKIDWKEYYTSNIKSARIHVLKESPDTVPKAKIRYTFLRGLHYATVCMLMYLCFVTLRLFLSSLASVLY